MIMVSRIKLHPPNKLESIVNKSNKQIEEKEKELKMRIINQKKQQ